MAVLKKRKRKEIGDSLIAFEERATLWLQHALPLPCAWQRVCLLHCMHVQLRTVMVRMQLMQLIIQRRQPSLFNREASYFHKYFCTFWHPNLATSLFLASFVPLKFYVILKTSLFFVWILLIFWMLMLASLYNTNST